MDNGKRKTMLDQKTYGYDFLITIIF